LGVQAERLDVSKSRFWRERLLHPIPKHLLLPAAAMAAFAL
jgi:hypothetical protein